ncbi:MAG: hypothetical protein KA359_01970, partial [Prevotella sp.]|nr:hypothetical protein [Prevotella sp.]
MQRFTFFCIIFAKREVAFGPLKARFHGARLHCHSWNEGGMWWKTPRRSKTSNPQPIGFSGILLAKRQNSFYCTYFLHN